MRSRNLKLEVLEERRMLDAAASSQFVELAYVPTATTAEVLAAANGTGDEEPVLGTIQGTKWNDLDGDGEWDRSDEPGLARWTIFLDDNDNGTLDSGESWTVTAADGSYSFTDLAPGEYIVAEVMKPGWEQTSPGGTEATELIVNGGFETGDFTGWTVNAPVNPYAPWTVGAAGSPGRRSPISPIEGEYDAWNGFDGGGPIEFTMYQDVSLPTAATATLSWQDFAQWSITGSNQPRTLQVQVRDPLSNEVLETVHTFTTSGTTGNTGWQLHTVDLSVYAGLDVRIYFVENIPQSFTGPGQIEFDAISLMVVPQYGPHELTLAAGETLSDINFGNHYIPPGEIHGFKWNDLDGDGEWDQPDEPGLAGWTIYLDDNNNGTLDAGESWTVTAQDGSYSFTGLSAGEYVVAEVLKPGWEQTSPGLPGTPGPGEASDLIVNGGFESGDFTGWTLENVGSGTFVVSNSTYDPTGPGTAQAPFTGVYSALSTQSSPGTHAIYQQVTLPEGSQSTLKWVDRIRNHASAFSDPNQEYRVEIRDTNNLVLATLFSTNPGDAPMQDWIERSADLSPYAGQTVRIAFVEQDNLGYFNVNIDDVLIEYTGPADPGVIAVVLAPGESASDVNFGNRFVPPSEIHGFKWNDLDGDGEWDQPDEPGLAGWTIYLDDNDNGTLDQNELWTVTAADGSYSFVGLIPGDYIVAEAMRPGWEQTFPRQSAERLFVLRYAENTFTIYELDRADGSVVNSFAAPFAAGVQGPQGLAFGNNSLFVIQGASASSHTLWELDPDTGAVIDSDVIDAGASGSFSGLGFLDGKVYVDKYTSDDILVWDPVADVAVTTLDIAADIIGGLTGAADQGVLFASNSSGRIFKIDPTTGTILATFTPPNVGSLNGGLAYINGEIIAARNATTNPAFRINPATGELLGTFNLGGIGSISALAGDGPNGPSRRHELTLVPGEIVTGIDFGNVALRPSGDFDGDGDVDGRDFLQWQRGFGKPTAGLADGDADYDQDVDTSDLAIWQEQYGVGESPAAPIVQVLLGEEEADAPTAGLAFIVPSGTDRTMSRRESLDLDDEPMEAVDRAFAELATSRRFPIRDFGDICVRRAGLQRENGPKDFQTGRLARLF
jgi:glutamine cyclotransferase